MRTSNVEMHAQARGTERVTFGFQPATGIYHVFPSILYV